MWTAAAAAANEQPEQSYALLNIVFIFAGVVVTVAGGVITALINRSAKTAPSPPSPDAGDRAPGQPDPGLEIRTIVRLLQERADLCDEVNDMMDRRIERHEVYLELIAQKLGIELPRPYHKRTMRPPDVPR